MHFSSKTFFYRFLEILPGALTWLSLFGSVIFSYFWPLGIAIYIILFDLYWVLKAVNTALHLLSSFSKLRLHGSYDWLRRLQKLQNLPSYKEYLRDSLALAKSRREKKDLALELLRLKQIDFRGRTLDFQKIYHLVILPTFRENLEVLDNSIKAILSCNYPRERIFLALAMEQREGEEAVRKAEILSQRYQESFLAFTVTFHPDGLPDEIRAKGANLSFAVKQVLPKLEELGIAAENVLVSAFDSDTVIAQNYFAYLTYSFLTAEKPYQTSYQPMPVYNNNIWDAPAIARVVAVANSFWQMIEASRPDRLVTFSSHALPLKALIEVDFWPKNVISDDSQIFWRLWLHYNGDYRTKPLFTTVSLDAMLDETYFKTLVGQYKQKRRWAWGIENFPYLTYGCLKNKTIPFWKKFLAVYRMIEGFYFWATASVMIVALGWLPLFLGGQRFGEGVLAFNLPLLTSLIMQIATIFLIFSVYFNMVLLPPRPAAYSRWRTVNMILQWFLVPIVSVVFGSFPAIDAQTRLMFGRYMEFWVTPKTRRSSLKDPAVIFSKLSRS